MRTCGAVIVGLSLLFLAGCGQSTAGGGPAPSSVAASPTHSTTASPDEDFNALKPTVLAADDVGNGWKENGEVRDGTPSHQTKSAQAPVEYCPGHVSEVFKVEWFAAAASQSFSKEVTTVTGNTSTTTDASLYLSASTLPASEAAGLRKAYETDVAACREYEVGDDQYVVMAPEGVASVPSADEMISSFSVRRYADKEQKKLSSVGQYAVARSGRVVVSVVINSLPTKDNGQGKDFAEVGKLLDQQIQASKAAVPA